MCDACAAFAPPYFMLRPPLPPLHGYGPGYNPMGAFGTPPPTRKGDKYTAPPTTKTRKPTTKKTGFCKSQKARLATQCATISTRNHVHSTWRACGTVIGKATRSTVSVTDIRLLATDAHVILVSDRVACSGQFNRKATIHKFLRGAKSVGHWSLSGLVLRCPPTPAEIWSK